MKEEIIQENNEPKRLRFKARQPEPTYSLD